jgi:endonuclease III
MESATERQERVRQIIRRLKKAYPDSRCLLNHQTPLELLVATILAAQCSDARVNLTTPAVFAKYPTAADYAAAPIAELERLFRSCGTFRQKARAVKHCCQTLLERHGGEVPADVAALASLPGVGRKTANVVLGNCFGVPSIIVDTHVLRLSGRLALASPHNVEKKYADKVEMELMDVVPVVERTLLSHLLGSHGRAVCVARKPDCPRCVIRELCPFPDKTEA